MTQAEAVDRILGSTLIADPLRLPGASSGKPARSRSAQSPQRAETGHPSTQPDVRDTMTTNQTTTNPTNNPYEFSSHRLAPADQRQLARELQQMIQPPRDTTNNVDGMRVAARCLSADPMLRVGGDWYLSMPLPDGDLLLAVGDAVGHGLSAAAAMVHLRYAMAAFAAEGHTPGAVLARLNALLSQRHAESIATAVVARYRPSTGCLTWARAGHHPMLLADRYGVEPLPNPRGALLGAFPCATYEHATRNLLPGDLVVMYTDGMFKRGQCIDQGMNDLADQVRRARECPTAFLDQLDYHASGDDACVLVAERVG